IRTNIKDFRDEVYSRFSSNPTDVINNMITNFEISLNENQISMNKIKKYPNDIPVLIKSYELGNILDNLFQNSIRFMQDSKEKDISIELYKESPKIILKFSNTGSIIPEDRWDIIFEQGYSEGGSTGQGLFSAREVLKKYGGRIYVDISVLEKTTFKIELNEGVNN
ncbi:MAG: HAMP domain-containing sensor histidine kinase, partial [Melioribacteraceae bacterium]|nr:HAMP domain-containing sensor histidine kinase [Melioribacteraceae bacterium]